MAKNTEGEKPVIIKKVIKKAGGHHGGAWKVAYADFVTAMMAFFLLLWLLNVATDEQLQAIAGYFDPTNPKISDRLSGAGGLLGGLSMSEQGAMTSNLTPIISSPPLGTRSVDGRGDAEASLERAKEILRAHEEAEFEITKKEIEQAIQDNPELAPLMKNLIVDMTPEGLRIQIVDQDGQSMFALGSARMLDHAKKLFGQVAQIIGNLPNHVSIRGHTDSLPYGSGAEYTNWELSSDRANSTRRVLLEKGFSQSRINNVMGKADTEHLVPESPRDPRNRRISMVLLKREITHPESFAAEARDIANRPAPPPRPFRRTEGDVHFP